MEHDDDRDVIAALMAGTRVDVLDLPLIRLFALTLPHVLWTDHEAGIIGQPSCLADGLFRCTYRAHRPRCGRPDPGKPCRRASEGDGQEKMIVRSSSIHRPRPNRAGMARMAAIALVLLASATAASAAEKERVCLSKSEQKAAISNGQAVTLAQAIRSIARLGARPRLPRGRQRQALPRAEGPRLRADSPRAGWQSHADDRRCHQRQGRRRALTGRNFLASPRDRGRSRPQPPTCHGLDRRGLCGRPRLRRRGGSLSRRDRAL